MKKLIKITELDHGDNPYVYAINLKDLDLLSLNLRDISDLQHYNPEEGEIVSEFVIETGVSTDDYKQMIYDLISMFNLPTEDKQKKEQENKIKELQREIEELKNQKPKTKTIEKGQGITFLIDDKKFVLKMHENGQLYVKGDSYMHKGEYEEIKSKILIKLIAGMIRSRSSDWLINQIKNTYSEINDY